MGESVVYLYRCWGSQIVLGLGNYILKYTKLLGEPLKNKKIVYFWKSIIFLCIVENCIVIITLGL